MSNSASYTEEVPSTNKGNERSFVANPKAPKGSEISEPTGPVASDSLAAESIKNKGGFAENSNPGLLGVRGDQSTLNTTDTSSADVLPPSKSSSTRETDEAAKLDTLGKPDFDGVHNQDGFVGGSGQTRNTTDASDSYAAASGNTSTSYSNTKESISTRSAASTATDSTGFASRPNVDAAPTYAADSRTEADLKPKGSNLQEGTDIPANRDTYTGDVGGDKDPGREALKKFSATNDDNSAGQTRDTGKADGGAFDALNSSENA